MSEEITETAEERTERLRKMLRLPRDVFAARVDRALGAVRGGDVIDILVNIKQSLDFRAPTPRERALVEAVLLQEQTGGRRPVICTCIRCGVNASIIATALVGFACCGSCWSYLNTLHGSLELVRLDVDLAKDDLDMTDVLVGSLDGVEL